MTFRQKKALAALLVQPTKEKAAEAAGIDPKTLRKYLADPEFQREYQKAFSEMVSAALRQAQQSLEPAMSTLREIVEDQAQNGAIRIQAARSLLEYALKLEERTELAEKIRALEKWRDENGDA